jgi:ribosomal protein S27AE
MNHDPSPDASRYWWRRKTAADKSACSVAARRGQTCPQCAKGILDHDSLLRLVCPRCGYFAGGGGYS